jgi:DNA-binding response OmpR family regulator
MRNNDWSIVGVTEKRVLLVDDDPALLRLIRQWLTERGIVVSACDTFNDAKQALLTSAPDVLLTDVRLGAFNGLQLVILAKQQQANTVAIVMSAFDDLMLRREAEGAGARYLTKPFSRDSLLGAVDEAIAEKSRIETL